MAVAAQKRHIEPLPHGLLRQPLDFILADHFRQRAVWGIIEEMANAPALDAALCVEVVMFLKDDLAIHVSDEEEDLFPLLRRSCEPEDEIEAVLGKLAEEHGADERMARDIGEGLSDLIRSNAAPRSDPALRNRILAFARSQRRHMMIENSIVIPLARARLVQSDIANLSRRMAARRGWAPVSQSATCAP